MKMSYFSWYSQVPVLIGTNSDDGDVMVAADGPQVFREGIPESSIDPTLEFIIQNYYTPAGEVWIAVNFLFL